MSSTGVFSKLLGCRDSTCICLLQPLPSFQSGKGLNPSNHHLSSSGNNGTSKGLSVVPCIEPTLPRNLATQTACPLARDRLMVALGCISISNQALLQSKIQANVSFVADRDPMVCRGVSLIASINKQFSQTGGRIRRVNAKTALRLVTWSASHSGPRSQNGQAGHV